MKLLLIAWFDPKGINAVLDHINAIRTKSKHDIDVFNTYSLKPRFRKYFRKSLNKYDGIIFHNTITYNYQSLLNLSQYFNPTLRDFSGIKILMKQDEMKNINFMREILKDWKVNILTTCLDKENVGKVYGEELLNSVSVVHTLTGYVTPELKNMKRVPLEDRKLDVVYRGMETPFEWGTLGHEKFYIGEEFNVLASKYNLKTDISSKTQDRIYGDKWYDFLSSSRATLAVESGASIFDFDGSIEKWCTEFKKNNPSAKFPEAFNAHLKQFDGLIHYNQISPRHIEAAALGTVQIMFEGEYSEIFLPDRHYIPLKKDFSNMDEVVQKLKDLNFCKRLVSNSITDILSRDDLTFDHFVKKLDASLEH